MSLRHQLAELLGYPTHAAFVLDDRMAKTPQAVATFLSQIQQKLTVLVDKEMEVMLQYKKEEVSFRVMNVVEPSVLCSDVILI